MLARYLAVLSLIAPFVFGDVKFKSPGAGSTITASGSTVAISVSWQDSGDDPPLSDLSTYSLYLYAGGNTAGTYVCSPSLSILSTIYILDFATDYYPIL